MPTWIALALVTALVQEPAPRVELRVVGPDGTPVRDAELRFACEDEHGGAIRAPEVRGGFRQGLRLDEPPLASQIEDLLRDRAFGTERTLTWPRDRGLLVEARRDEAWGFAWFPRDWRETTGRDHPAGAPLTIEIAPDWNLAVEVLDAAGQPVRSTALRLLREERGSHDLSPDQWPVVFEHLGFQLRHDPSAATIRVDGLFAAPVEARLEPRRRPVRRDLEAVASARARSSEPSSRAKDGRCNALADPGRRPEPDARDREAHARRRARPRPAPELHARARARGARGLARRVLSASVSGSRAVFRPARRARRGRARSSSGAWAPPRAGSGRIR